MENVNAHKREVQGTVVSISGDKTAKISVVRTVLHQRYHKIVKKFKNYMIHDEENTLKVGDEVIAVESRPFSKRKRFALKTIVKSEN
jgi:small subunit ribosomal protein S17